MFVAPFLTWIRRSRWLQASLAFDLRYSCAEAQRPVLLRKEVIQPQVPLRLPCYDFIPVTAHTLDGLAVGFGYKRLP